MRTPRKRPDLRLAESYVPAALTLLKGLVYTSVLCVLLKWNAQWGWLPPLMLLYYDHMFWPLSFHAFAYLDSSSICGDVVGGTMISWMMRGGVVWKQNVILVIWMLLGACHILLWPQLHDPLPYMITGLGNMLITMGAVCGVVYCTATENSEPSGLISPFIFRSTLYLLLVMIDAYTLRGPVQRERDKMGVLRYGALLLAPSIMLVILCCLFGIAAQAIRLFYLLERTSMAETEPKASKAPLPLPSCSLRYVEEGKSRATASSNNSVDSLDINEAFRLAKLQYKDVNKSNH